MLKFNLSIKLEKSILDLFLQLNNNYALTRIPKGIL